jgi:hypothetical protein
VESLPPPTESHLPAPSGQLGTGVSGTVAGPNSGGVPDSSAPVPSV